MSKNLSVTLLKNLLLILYTAFLAFPLLWVISLSFKTSGEIYSGVVTLIPNPFTYANYKITLFEQSIISSMINSFKVGVFATIGVVLIALPAAYSLVRYRSVLNKGIIGWILASQIFPVILIMIPLYVILRNLGLTDTHAGLSIVYVVWNLPFVLWMLQGYIKSIPVELEEAAEIDGANKFQVIFKIILPVLLPAVGASALFAFISAWNEFFFALVLMKSQDLITLPVDLARYTGMEGQAQTGLLAAASVIATIPSLILFAFLQKFFSGGLILGAVKE